MDQSLVQVDYSESVAIVRMTRGSTNAINLALIEELESAVRSVGQDKATCGLVLCSASVKFFSIGFDLPSLLGIPRDEFCRFFAAFNRLCIDLYTLAKPTVAAIAGHAVAGGCILALACDYRYAAEGRRLVGLNEIKLGVPVPYAADRMLLALVGYRNAREVADTGEFYAAEDATRLGLLDAVFPAEKLLSSSIETVMRLGKMPGTAFAQIKENRVGPTMREIESALEQKDREFVDAWYSPATQDKLKEAAGKF